MTNDVLTPQSATECETHAEDEISLLDLLIVLVQRKRMILGIPVLFAVLAVAASLLLQNRYTATVTILPPQQSSSLSSVLTSQLGSVAALAGGGGSLLKNPNEKYVAMFKSRTVEEAMVQRYGLMQEYHKKYLSDAAKAFEHNATVDGSSKDGLIRISVTNRDPRRAAELANGYVEQFQQFSAHLAITEAAQRRLFFQKQLEEAKNQLADAEEALKETEQTTGMISVDSQSKALVESATTLKAQIAMHEVAIQGMRTYATGQNAQLIQAEKELESLRGQLAQLGGSSNSKDDLLIPKGKIPQSGLEYLRKVRDVKYYETIFEILARQFEIAKLDEAKEGSLFQIVDSAIPPDRKSGPRRSLIVLAAVVAGSVIGIVMALLQAFFSHMKDDPETANKLQLIKAAFFRRKPATEKSIAQ